MVGGKPTGRTGTFFEPTVLADVDDSMSCMTEETFGPMLPVMKVADEAEAIRLANDSDYGLSATVWTADKKRGERVARQLDVGAVNINDAIANAFSLALPLGGWKQSGVGYPLRRRQRNAQVLPAAGDHDTADSRTVQGTALVPGVTSPGQVGARGDARGRRARRAPVRHDTTIGAGG